MNTLDKKYTDLLQDILDNGTQKGDRTGTGTISVFGRQIRHKMSEGFPLLTTKKMPFKTIVTELLWFLRGDTNIKFLVDNNCHIWDGDTFKEYIKKEKIDFSKVLPENYEHAYNSKMKEFIDNIKASDEFAKKWGELGPIYGSQWRTWDKYDFTVDNDYGNGEYGGGWNIKQIDQIQNLIKELKTNPDSRRLMVNAWNVGELDNMVLPPCHYGFQVYTRELSQRERLQLLWKVCKEENIPADSKELEDFWLRYNEIMGIHNIPKRVISLMWTQRSVDTFLGLPFNIASYGLLLEIIAKAVNMVPDELIGNLGDVHLYSNHVEQAKEQIGRELTREEIQEHLQQSGMDALKYEVRMEYISKLPKRTREPFPLPKLNINTEFWPTESGECGVGPIDTIALINGFSNDDFCKSFLTEDLQLINYQSHPTIKAPLSN